MDAKEFRAQAHIMADRMADYLEQVNQYPVKSLIKPGSVFEQIDEHLPQEHGSIEAIMRDFEQIIVPGLTHWESPNFMAYFPASKSGPSILAEMLTAALGTQGMIWATSPAAAELEERMMEWLKQLLHLPASWQGCIQDTASTATLTAMLTAREKHTDYSINQQGFSGQRFRIYCSEQAHSSIDKAVKIAGFGIENLIKIAVDDKHSMQAAILEEAILKDIEAGFVPLLVVAALGTTGTTGIDPIAAIGLICKKHKLWLHVDAAYAGTALMLEEKKWMSEGLSYADSFVFNPHKWMFVNFDCSIYYVRDSKALIDTFSITPEYLRTLEDKKVNNYRDWGIQLGRRFRALKLWFVLRYYGAEGLKIRIRNHCIWAEQLADSINSHIDFEVLMPVTVNLICFRWIPDFAQADNYDKLNERLMESINKSGKLYLSHTKIDEKFAIRLVAGHPGLDKKHLDDAWILIKTKAMDIKRKAKA